MHGNTYITIAVELTIPLSLANRIEAEADRLQMSIPDLLSRQLIEAHAVREYAEFEDAAAQRHQGIVNGFDDTNRILERVANELATLEPPAPTPPGGVDSTPASPPSS